MAYPDEVYWLALSQWKGIGPVYGQQLIRELDSLKQLFETGVDELKEKFSQFPANVWSVDREELMKWAEKQYKHAQKHKVQVIPVTSDKYPIRFRHFENMPLVLFYKGTAPLNTRRVVGIIGTRNPTDQGKVLCEQLVADLKSYDPLIVSGLAYGADVTAHRAALKNGLNTIGVMGTGMQEIYPPPHRKTATKMVQQGGLLSQFPFGAGPEREHFPMRNRLLAALSDALVVIESKRRGGSMITAQFANNFNKDVFAFPGRAVDLKSQGCNLLIKSHRANLMEGVEDIAYIMRWEKADQPKEIQRKLFVEMTGEEEKLLDLVRKDKEAHIEQLTQNMQMDIRKLSSLLLELEFKGLIKSLPGNRYIAV